MGARASFRGLRKQTPRASHLLAKVEGHGQVRGLHLVLNDLNLFLLFGPKLLPARENQINTGLPKSNRHLHSQSRKDQVAFQIEAIVTLQKTEYKSLTMWVRQSGIKSSWRQWNKAFQLFWKLPFQHGIFLKQHVYLVHRVIYSLTFTWHFSFKCPMIINYSALVLVT